MGKRAFEQVQARAALAWERIPREEVRPRRPVDERGCVRAVPVVSLQGEQAHQCLVKVVVGRRGEGCVVREPQRRSEQW